MGVLTVDPSSVRTGGSVLGDKTRMARLSADPDAYIRPSPSAGTLGGVARATTQSMAVLEAAGYDVVLVETVGVGQSEVTVAGMVDTFLFLTLARTGDQLQGIKKGILEIADVIAVNKADGDREGEARSAARELAGALRLVRGHAEWAPPVVTVSALHDRGVGELWEQVLGHRDHLGDGGPGPQARRAAARLHLGAGARRARAAAASLTARPGGPRRRPRGCARRRPAGPGGGRPDPRGLRRGPRPHPTRGLVPLGHFWVFGAVAAGGVVRCWPPTRQLPEER